MTRKNPLRRWFFIGLTVGLGVLFALSIGEVTLRLIRPLADQGTYLIWPPYYSTVFLPRSDLMPGILGPSHFQTNSIGLRGKEPSDQDDMRILCIGGSTTECLFLDQEEAWPGLLETDLNQVGDFGSVWVGNAGMSGRTTRHNLVALNYLPLEDLGIDTIIFLTGVNDLLVFVEAGDQFVPWDPHDPVALDELLPETFFGSHGSRVQNSILKNTALGIEVRNVRRWLFSEDRQDQAGKVYKTWRANRQKARPFSEELPDLGAGLREYRENIECMIDLSRAKGCRPVFMTQPSMWRSDLPEDLQALLWFGGLSKPAGHEDDVLYSHAVLEQAIDAYNDTLIRTCRSRGAECLDLAAKLPKDSSAFYDDVHFNENGARIVASALVAYLREFPSGVPAEVQSTQ